MSRSWHANCSAAPALIAGWCPWVGVRCLRAGIAAVGGLWLAHRENSRETDSR